MGTGYFKFIFAGLGFLFFNYSLGMAILGFIIGSIVDVYPIIKKQLNAFQNGEFQGAFNRAGGMGGQSYGNPQDIFNYYQRQSQRYDFPTMLIALSAAVMKADGKVLKVELNYVKNFFSRQFGDQFNTTHLQTLKEFIDAPNIPIDEICRDINMRMQPAMRTQLIHYLFGIAKADGTVGNAESDLINRISRLLGVGTSDYTSVKNMFQRDTDSDFKILGITKDATDDEVKKAYRKMAIKFHPDKVAQMGEEYQKGAKEKFQQINDAYEAIKKARGIK